MYFNLMITEEGIHEAEKLMLGGRINDQVNLWQKKLSFGQAMLRSVKSIHTLHLPILGGDDNVGKSIQIIGLFYDIGLDDLIYFFFYNF